MSAVEALPVWFGRCGRPIDGDDRALAQAWVDACGVPASMRLVGGWHEAATWLRERRFSEGFWAGEERQRWRLRTAAAARLGEAGLLERLTQATEPLVDVLREAATLAASRDGVRDEGLIRAAAGAAALAAHQCALARLGGAFAAHPFFCKHRLFTRGRWPFGLFGDAGRAIAAIL